MNTLPAEGHKATPGLATGVTTAAAGDTLGGTEGGATPVVAHDVRPRLPTDAAAA